MKPEERLVVGLSIGGIILFGLLVALAPDTPAVNGDTEPRVLTFYLGYEHSVSGGAAAEYYYSGITFDGGSLQAIITRSFISRYGSSDIELRIHTGDTVYLDDSPYQLTEVHKNYIVLEEVQ